MRKKLATWRDFLIRQKTRFDLGIQFLTFLNFALLVMAASDKIKIFIPMQTRLLVVAFVPLAFFGVWAFGHFLEKVVKFPQQSDRMRAELSPTNKLTQDKLDRIIELLEKQ
ncbi:MAG: hypothetical protein WC838_00370 [Candidatus Margulisiibacteriota bacterium]|jgi:hypothetical protein